MSSILDRHPDAASTSCGRGESREHVLSQSLFVENLDDGRELIELAEQRDLKFAVNQNSQLGAASAYVREAVRAGLMEKLPACMFGSAGITAGLRDVVRSDGRSLPLDFGIHWFDLLASVIGDRARFVHATTARAPNRSAAAAFGSGACRL